MIPFPAASFPTSFLTAPVFALSFQPGRCLQRLKAALKAALINVLAEEWWNMLIWTLVIAFDWLSDAQT